METIKQYQSDPRYQAYLSDKDKYGDFQEGDYNGFHWYAYRVQGVSMDHWCGSVDLGKTNASNATFDALNNASHGGITGGYNDTSFGFDTAHYGDFSPKPMMFIVDTFSKKMPEKYCEVMFSLPPNSYTYKDFPYVKRILYQMIDAVKAL